jgi:uncharacterized membrane protein
MLALLFGIALCSYLACVALAAFVNVLGVERAAAIIGRFRRS